MTAPAITERVKKRGPRLRRFLSLPVLAATTVLTAAVSWIVPRVLEGSQPAVSVIVQDNPSSFGAGAGTTKIFPRAADITGNPGKGCWTFHSWARRLGGLDVNETNVRLLVQGKRDVPIVISGLRANVIERDPPQSGTAVSCPTAGVIESRAIAIDLDAPVPVGRRVGQSTEFGFTLAKGETEVFDITATTSRSSIAWSLKLDLVIDGAAQEMDLLPPDHAPFRTTASSTDRAYTWDYEDSWLKPEEAGNSDTTPSIPVGAPLPPL